MCGVSGAERDGSGADNQVDRSPPSFPLSFIWIMHANYLLAESRTVTPQAPADISMHIQARIQTHMPVRTLPGTRTHILWLSRSSSTYLLNTGTFTIETSENLVDKLEGIPLTKEPVKTVCRLMIDYIHHCAGRAEQSTSSVTLLNCSFLPKSLTAEVTNIYYWYYLIN